jgi:hypothetical protein
MISRGELPVVRARLGAARTMFAAAEANTTMTPSRRSYLDAAIDLDHVARLSGHPQLVNTEKVVSRRPPDRHFLSEKSDAPLVLFFGPT